MMEFKEWLEISDIEDEQGIRLQRVAEGLVTPTSLTHDGEKIYITDQMGYIYVVNSDGSKSVFLNISERLRKLGPSAKGEKPGFNMDYDERGLLGLAFHPNQKGRYFIFHSDKKESDYKNINCDSVLTEYNDKKRKELLRIPQEKHSHNGGNIKFGPDGYLYIPTGDGGCCGEKGHGEIGNAQNLGSLKGKILRIDVNGGGDYRIPPDNPFVGMPGVRPEIYAYGFRNPWQISFDGNKLYVGSVGEGEDEIGEGWESVFVVKKGGNHGWAIKEGSHWMPKGKELLKKLRIKESDLVKPIYEYSHKEGLGISIIGGYIYKGEAIPELKGSYVFGDWSKAWTGRGGGALYYLKKNKLGKWKRYNFKYPDGKKHLDNFLLAFGEGPDNELYILTKKGIKLNKKQGVVYKLTK